MKISLYREPVTGYNGTSKQNYYLDRRGDNVTTALPVGHTENSTVRASFPGVAETYNAVQQQHFDDYYNHDYCNDMPF